MFWDSDKKISGGDTSLRGMGTWGSDKKISDDDISLRGMGTWGSDKKISGGDTSLRGMGTWGSSLMKPSNINLMQHIQDCPGGRGLAFCC